MPQVGDVVKYVEGENEYNALVLRAHAQEVTHLGAHGEPLLHLVLVRKDPLTGKDGIDMQYDVVHISHQFSEEYKRQHGDNAGRGRWYDNNTLPSAQDLDAAAQEAQAAESTQGDK